MTKSVASLVDYRQQAFACNRRYLDAFAVMDDPAPASNTVATRRAQGSPRSQLRRFNSRTAGSSSAVHDRAR